MVSIGEGDYEVVEKEPCVVHGLSVFLFFRELRKIRPPARKKKIEGKLWAGPPTDKDGARLSRGWNDEAGRQRRDEERAPGPKTRRDPDRDARIGIGGQNRRHGQIQQSTRR